MFRTPAAAAAPPAHDADPADDLVPVSVLSLDLGEPPAEGWAAYLASRQIAIGRDDIGRPSVSRQDAKMLLTERAEGEARKAQHREAAERQAVEADRQRRAQIWRGVPAGLLPPDVHPATVMLQAVQDARPRRQSVLQHALENTGELTYHSFRSTPDGDEP